MDLTQRLCSVCENFMSPVSGSLSCGHTFCTRCFTIYLNGSLDELKRSIRCCICGNITSLTLELKRENLIDKFGRSSFPAIMHATGITINKNGNYVIFDQASKRIYIFDQAAKVIRDFSHLYKYDVMYGITVDKQGRIIVPTITKDSTNIFNTHRHKALAYYHEKGHPTGFTFLDNSCDIRGLASTIDGNVIATDIANSKLWFIHEQQRVIFQRTIEQEIGECEIPQPWGICIDKESLIYITDVGNHCIKVLDKNGYLIFMFGSQGERAGQFNFPCGVTTDESSRIIVADKLNHRVQIFDRYGKFERFVVRFNRGDDVYMLPVDVEYIGNNRVAVLLRGEKDANVSEVRIYPCDGDPSILSC